MLPEETGTFLSANTLRPLVRVAVVAVALAAGLFPASANAATPDSSAHTFIRSQMDKYGVPQSQRAGLLAKHDSGYKFDANTGSTPASVDHVTIEGVTARVERFPDGSFRASGLQTPVPSGNPTIQADSITGCKTSSAQGVAIYTGCLVKSDTLTLTLSFRASYQRWSSGAQITGVSSWDAQTAGGSHTRDYFGILKKTSNSNTSPAKAQLRVTVTVVGGLGTSSPYTQLNVAPTKSAWITTNW